MYLHPQELQITMSELKPPLESSATPLSCESKATATPSFMKSSRGLLRIILGFALIQIFLVLLASVLAIVVFNDDLDSNIGYRVPVVLGLFGISVSITVYFKWCCLVTQSACRAVMTEQKYKEQAWNR